MRVSATAKYLRGSTRKARLVTQAIKGKRGRGGRCAPALHAPARRHATWPRVLKSADGERREQPQPVRRGPVHRRSASPNEGPTIKRWRPRAQGRAFPIHKPMTHITVIVEDREA